MTEAESKPPAAAPPPFKMPEDEPDEFAHIPSRGGRPPILALAAVALALFLGVRLRHDVIYAFTAASPRPLGNAQTLATRPLDSLPLNRHVQIDGVPERESAVILDTRGSWKFSQFFRLRGTNGRVFVKRVSDPLPVRLAERDRFAGRLLPFSDLSFSASIARHFASDVSATRFFRPQELAALPPAERLHLDLLRPGHYRVQLPRDRFPDRARASQAVTGQGARVLSDQEEEERILLEVEVPEASRERILSGIGDLDRGVRLRPARETLEATAGELSVTDGGLQLRRSGGEPRVIPLPLVVSIRTRDKLEVPADAVLLIEGERPRDSWPSLVVLAFLLAFALVNLLGLKRPT